MREFIEDIQQADNVFHRHHSKILTLDPRKKAWQSGEHLTPRDRQHSLHYVGFNHEGLNVKEPWIFSRIYAVSLAVTLA